MSENANRTTWWVCDKCGGRINSERDGWVEWLNVPQSNSEWAARGLRLVHHTQASPLRDDGGCQYDEKREFQNGRATVADDSLEDYLGPDGLMQLLAMLSEGQLPKSEVIEMIQRLHIPGYEEARRYMPRAIAEGSVEPNLPKGFHWQSDLERVIAEYGDKS